jgi:hypothetical protein
MSRLNPTNGWPSTDLADTVAEVPSSADGPWPCEARLDDLLRRLRTIRNDRNTVLRLCDGYLGDRRSATDLRGAINDAAFATIRDYLS